MRTWGARGPGGSTFAVSRFEWTETGDSTECLQFAMPFPVAALRTHTCHLLSPALPPLERSRTEHQPSDAVSCWPSRASPPGTRGDRTYRTQVLVVGSRPWKGLASVSQDSTWALLRVGFCEMQSFWDSSPADLRRPQSCLEVSGTVHYLGSALGSANRLCVDLSSFSGPVSEFTHVVVLVPPRSGRSNRSQGDLFFDQGQATCRMFTTDGLMEIQRAVQTVLYVLLPPQRGGTSMQRCA